MSLRYAILGLLANDELSGYELTKRFDRSVAYFWQARSQQIYPELARLEADGLVTGRLVEQVGRPDKRLYRITDAGQRSLRKWVVTPSPPTLVKDEFMVKVYCYGLIDPLAAKAAAATHRELHEQRLAGYRAFERFLSQDPDGIKDGLFGAYLTLLGGIAVEEAFTRWSQLVEQLHEQRAHREPPPIEPTVS
jgi:DNA-binding PadR family transcriptional regulator